MITVHVINVGNLLRYCTCPLVELLMSGCKGIIYQNMRDFFLGRPTTIYEMKVGDVSESFAFKRLRLAFNHFAPLEMFTTYFLRYIILHFHFQQDISLN